MKMRRTFNETLTVYNRYQDIASGQWTSIRTVIPHVHYQENSVNIFNLTGVSQSNNVNLTILRYRGDGEPVMLPQAEWNALTRAEAETGNYFLVSQNTFTIYLRGIYDYVFPWYATTGLLTTAETNFKNTLQPSGTAAIWRNSRDCNIAFYGRRGLQNAQIRLG